jgi:glycerate 2-kinase
MLILVAPNAFKNSLSAEEVAESIRLGLIQSGLPCEILCFPIGDGGDGTASLIIGKLGGLVQEVIASDPIGRKIKSFIGFIDGGKTAVLEMAEISGLKLLQPHELNPLHTSSYGCGELIRTALDRGARKIILGIGGTATVDGGCGILRALGVRFLDQSKNELIRIPDLVNLDSIDVDGIDRRIFDAELIVLCDVNNFLLGDQGAAAVFGPQKGASAADVASLENSLRQFKEITFLKTGRDMNAMIHGGAAGGAAAAMSVFLGANLVQGIEYFLDLTGFDEVLTNADILITAEGSIDLQTLDGKGPFGVAKRARKKNIPVIGLAGQVPLETNSRLSEIFDVLMAIGHQPEEMEAAIEHTPANLRRYASQLGALLRLKL